MAIIDIQNVTTYQQSTKVFDGFSLQISQGEKVAILGPNGAGKSTLLKLLSRDLYPVDRPDSHVKIFGSNTLPIWELREQIGYVSHELQEDYTPYTKALDVIASGFVGAIGTHDHLQITPEQTAQAEAMLKRLGLDNDRNTMMQRLSTGQKRRLLLGRALIHQPNMLILDEPSNGLDMGAALDMLTRLQDFCAPKHTLMLATHHIDEIVPEIERLVLINKGKIVADGAKEAVLTSDNLSELYGTPLEVIERDGWYRCWQKKS